MVLLSYFQDINLLADILNNLTLNTVDRFNFKNISKEVKENDAKDRK
jgi:hypothetical protein